MDKQFYVNIVRIIDAGSERGAWRGPELEGVSVIRKTAIAQAKKLEEEESSNNEKTTNKEDTQVASITKVIGED